MKEYIDKEDVIDIIFAVFASHWKLDCSGVDDMIQRKVVHAKNKIKEAPAADVVEVIRCKDCIHYIPFAGTVGLGLCKHGFTGAEENAFCSYGERRDDRAET